MGEPVILLARFQVMLQMSTHGWLAMLAESWRVYPEEACGLLLGPAGRSQLTRFVPVENAAKSSRIFQLDSRGFMKAERAADDAGLEVIGVMHSHTHTAAYPSPTDIGEATKPLLPPTWHWVIVSLAWGEPEVRSFVVDEGAVRSFVPTPGFPAAGIAEESLRLIE